MFRALLLVIVSPSLKFGLTLLGFELTALLRPPLHRFLFVIIYFPLTFIFTAFISSRSYIEDEFDVPVWFYVMAEVKSYFELVVLMIWIEWRFGFFSIARSFRRANDMFRSFRRVSSSGPILPTYS